MKPIDLSKILEPHVGKWVALNNKETKVIATARTFDALVKKTEKIKDTSCIVFRVLKNPLVTRLMY